MKVLFLHGWQSTPGGVKPTYLKDHGHEVLNPALPDDDFDAAVRIAQVEFDQHSPDVVVGSSRGGAVAMNIDSGSTPLVLLCPAWKRFGTARTVKLGTIILHSRDDEVVPFSDSEELVRNSRLPESALVVVGHEHRLADPESLAKMLKAVEEAAKQGQVAKTGMKRPFVTMKGLGCAFAFLSIPILIDLFGMLIALVMPIFARGIQVTVQNTGSQSLSTVVLHVIGNRTDYSYNVGDIAPGISIGAVIGPDKNSHLEIEFTDDKGQRKRLKAGENFEQGYKGTIWLSIKDGVIDRNERQASVR